MSGFTGKVDQMNGLLSMSIKERWRLRELSRVERGELKLVDAARILELSYRQCLRVWARYKTAGAAGLVHRGRGRPSNRGAPAKFRRRVLARYEKRYRGFGPTLAAEKLVGEGLLVDHETLRRWLISEGKWKKQRKRLRHRSWRARCEHFGEMVQMDGSPHRWFEDRGEASCLMDMVDDATGTREAVLEEAETTAGAMRLLWRWIARYGIPKAIYVDKKNIFVVDKKSRQRAKDEGRELVTQFGLVCKKLGIRIITANSPQAKGRVERQHRIYQDRLVKELRLQNINTLDAARRLLDEGFLDDLNEKFTVEAASAVDYHRSASGIDLASIFCFEYERSVTADWIVRFENRFFQLEPPQKRDIGRGKVLVQRRLDGSLHFQFRGQYLSYAELPERPQTNDVKNKKKKRPSETIIEKYVPTADHPWRKYPAVSRKPQLQGW